MSKNRIIVVCNVHEGGVWEGKTARLQQGIQAAYNKHANPEAELKLVWITLPKGQAWLAGEPSTASTLVVPAPDDISQDQRVAMMSDICDDWMSVTGCSVNEIIVNAMALSEVKRYFKVAQTRFNPKQSLALKTKLAMRVMHNRIKHGFLASSINMP